MAAWVINLGFAFFSSYYLYGKKVMSCMKKLNHVSPAITCMEKIYVMYEKIKSFFSSYYLYGKNLCHV